MAESEEEIKKRRYRQALELGIQSGLQVRQKARQSEFGGQIPWAAVLQHDIDVNLRPEPEEVKRGLRNGFRMVLLDE